MAVRQQLLIQSLEGPRCRLPRVRRPDLAIPVLAPHGAGVLVVHGVHQRVRERVDVVGRNQPAVGAGRSFPCPAVTTGFFLPRERVCSALKSWPSDCQMKA